MIDSQIAEGTRIRYTADNLGALDSENPYRFSPHHVSEGDEGTYVGPHPTLPGKGWHLTEWEHEGETYTVPVSEGMFEVLS